VLIIDDSAVVRKVLTKEIEKDPGIQVIGTAIDPYIGRDKIVQFNPDVVVLDIELPKMDGLTFLGKLMRSRPMPVVVVSSLTKKNSSITMKAYDLGASEVISKPSNSYSLKNMSEQLRYKIKAAYEIKKFKRTRIIKEVKPVKNNVINSGSMLKTTDKVIAIGASTGGVEAITKLLKILPSGLPPIIIVQHLPAFFTKAYAENLNMVCKMEVHEALDGEKLTYGKVLLAPGNKHMALRKKEGQYHVEIMEGPMIFYQRPSVEILFESVAKYAGANAIGIILTGMGKDGAQGLLKMRNAGAFTIAQNEESCVVFGMPREAISIGAVEKVEPLDNIPNVLLDLLNS